MSNYSAGHAQVPFGDGICTGDTLAGDDLTEDSMNKAMKDIFMSCDADNIDKVQVSKLIDFITPFMQQNITELLVLKKALDPHNVDPDVNSETFYKVMTEWTSQLRGPDVTDDSLNSSTPCKLTTIMEKESTSSNALSEKSSLGNAFLKGYIESGSHNLSTSSSCSIIGNNGSGTDVSILQEHINELEHQNRKLTEELTLVRVQLANSEEQNDALQSEMDKVSRKLAVEQHMHGQLQTSIKESEESLETSVAAQKQIGKLEKLLAFAEKENFQLKQTIHTMETEKQKLEDNIEQLAKREGESKRLLVELQLEMNYKEQEITSLEETTAQLKNKLGEQQNIIAHYTDVNERLKMDKVKLEQRFRERLTQTYSNQSKSPSSSFSEYCTPTKSGISKQLTNTHVRRQSTHSNNNNTPDYTTPSSSLLSPRSRIMRNLNTFNSPKLLANIANPVSPCLDSPVLSSSRKCKKSVDSDSPVVINSTRVVNSILADTTSTPEEQRITRKILLDETLPSVARRLPILSPVGENNPNEPNNSELPKKDLSFFSQYRLVGSFNEDNQTDDLHSVTGTLFNDHVKQEYDTNLNIIIPKQEQKDTPPSFFNENESNDPSLPTMYVVERTGVASKEKNLSSSSPRSGVLDSSEDEVLWKVQMMNYSPPHESLEQEMIQADNGCEKNECKHLVNKLKCNNHHLEAKTLEYENTIKQLVKDINHLHVQHAKSEKHITDCEEKYKQLQAKYKQMEGDNSSKYIKIVDLMEQTEVLQNQLIDTDDKFAELFALKEKIKSLQQEKEKLREQLKHWEKHNSSNTLLQRLQSMKNESDLLRSRLDLSTKAEQKLSKEFENICCENCELRKNAEMLEQTICELDAEKAKLTNNLQKLSEDYNTLKVDIKHKNEREIEICGKLTKLLNENVELKEKLSKEEPEKTQTHIEQMETLRITVREHTNTIEKIFQTMEEKKRQISMLKKMINYQNQNIKALESNKVKSVDQIYEQKCTNDTLLEENRELRKKLEVSEKEKIRIQSQLLSLGDSNKCVRAELEDVRCDNKKMKDAENILKEQQSLMEEKELLTRNIEEISKDNNMLKELNTELGKHISDLEKDKNDLSSTITELNMKLHSAEMEIAELKEKICEIEDNEKHLTNNLKDEITQLQNTSQILESQNKCFLQELETIKSDCEVLVSEREVWRSEKNNWQEMEDNYVTDLTNAKLEANRLQERLREIEANSPRLQEPSHDDDEVFCKNCITLKTEMDELNTYIDELNGKITALETEERNSKKGNFEKMRLIIEKLKARTDEVEQLLKNEKQKAEALEQINITLLEQVNDGVQRHNKEKTAMTVEKSALEEKLNELVETLERTQTEKQEAEREKDYISRNSANFEKKLHDATNENEQLQQNIADLHSKKVILDRKIVKLQRDMKIQVCHETKTEAFAKAKEELLENSKKTNERLHLEVNDLRCQRANLEKQLEELQNTLKDQTCEIEKYVAEIKGKDELVDSINKESVLLQQQMENLCNQKNNLEKKLEKTQHDLQKSEAKTLSIRKLLTDMRSGVYDDGDDALQENVKALLKEKDSQVSVLEEQLKNYEEKLTEVKIELCESKNSLSSLSEHVEVVNKNLSEKRERLSRSILTLVNNWRMILENRADMRIVLEALNVSEAPSNIENDNNQSMETTPNKNGPLAEELLKFKHQIYNIAEFLEALSTLKLSVATNTDGEKIFSENTSQAPLSQRFVKKVTLKTTTTEVRSIDPDDPLKEETYQTETSSPLNNKEGDLNSGDDSNKPSRYPHHMEGTLLKVGNEGFVHNSSLEVASPSLSDTVLESLNLLHKGPSPKLTETEMEDTFGILVTAFMIDVSSIKDRYRQQQTHQNEIENNFSVETEKLLTTLRKMQGLNKECHLESQIQICLEQVALLIRMFSQTSASAMQYGALHHEHRLVKCINLMINHAAYLKRIVENATHQLKSIRSTSLSPKREKYRSLSNRSSSSDMSVSSSKDILEEDSISSNKPCDATEQVNLTGTVNVSSDSSFYLHKRVFNGLKRRISRTRDILLLRNATPYECFWLVILFLFGFCFILLGIQQIKCGNNISSMYPWQWVSWNDVLAPYIKKSYPYGPPPS